MSVPPKREEAGDGRPEKKIRLGSPANNDNPGLGMTFADLRRESPETLADRLDSVRRRLSLEPELYATPYIIPDSVVGICFGMLTRLIEGRPDMSAIVQTIKHACEVSIALALAERDRAVARQNQLETLIPRPVLAELPLYRQPALGPGEMVLSPVEYGLPDITEDEEEQAGDRQGAAYRSGRRAKRRQGGSGSSDGSEREAGQGASSVSPPTPSTPA